MSTATTDSPPRRRRAARRPRTGPVLNFAALVLLAALFMIPIYVIVMAGLRPAHQSSATHMWQLPSELDLSGITQAWAALGPNFGVSLAMALPATILSSLIGALNGYVFAKLTFRRANLVFAFLLLGMFIPYQVILVPLVRFLQEVGLYGTVPGLVLVHVIYGIPVTTLIFRNYYTQLPTEILEAGRVDGASDLAVFRRILLPLSLPGFVVCGIFQFTNIWNDFLFGITVVPDPTRQPITAALNNLAGNFSVQWNAVMSGALIAAVPTALAYVLLGRYFVRGLTAGAVK